MEIFLLLLPMQVVPDTSIKDMSCDQEHICLKILFSVQLSRVFPKITSTRNYELNYEINKEYVDCFILLCGVFGYM